MKLERYRQCELCPWKVSTDPLDIPDGYTLDKHRALSSTIADGINLGNQLHVMCCHEHPAEKPAACVGWLMNQLGPGNNILLRMAVRNNYDVEKVVLVGEQHNCFEDTLPKLENE